jgi:uncharacterized membrane-anchored protein
MPLLNRETLVKVPEITVLFWIAKLGTTCFGEAFSDYVFFNDYIGRTAAILMGLALILVCYAIQIATKKYIPRMYWIAVTAVAIFGTMSADFLNKNLGMSLTESTILLLVLQAAVFPGPHPGSADRLALPPPERGVLLLARLHDHRAARRVLRRLSRGACPLR